MASENALGLLSQLDSGKAMLPAAIVIAGPQTFLKEYVFDCCCAAIRAKGLPLQHFQVGSGDDLGAVIEAACEPSLFAPATAAACRILRSRRGAESDAEEEGGEQRSAGGGGVDSGLARALDSVRLPSHLIVLYERDSAPAKIARQVEKAGLMVACNRPFESHLAQYAAIFARRLGLRLSSPSADLLVMRYGANLLAIHNALALASLVKDDQNPDDFLRAATSGARAGGELFALSESLTAPSPTQPFAVMDSALTLGRDPVELLAVEVIPAIRRMLTAAQLSAKGSSTTDIAMALGLSPRSPMAAQAVAAAHRYGEPRLAAVYAEAIDLDAGFKSGSIRERESALSLLIAHLVAGDGEPARSRRRA